MDTPVSDEKPEGSPSEKEMTQEDYRDLYDIRREEDF